MLGCRESPGADPELIAFDLNKLSNLREQAVLLLLQHWAGKKRK